ncbi:MAG: hypothetical protein ABI446_05280 [Gemmatimonadaceae bacterium]
MHTIRFLLTAALVVSPQVALTQATYLFVWAGGDKGNAEMATIDATPGSATYGKVVASASTGSIGHPHHTEAVLASSGHILANDFHAGRTWLFDLHEPLHPRVLTSFGDIGGYGHPHTFVRLGNGHVLATFQYRASGGMPTGAMFHGMPAMGPHTTGGLVEMDEMGRVFKSGSAIDKAIDDSLIFPYSVLPIPAMDRAISTVTDMDPTDSLPPEQWVQLWRLSDLKLLKSFALQPGPRGDENKLTGEARLLADGKSVLVHTFSCGLYLVRNIESDKPTSMFVHGFEGIDCGVPILTSHYWLQTVPDAHALVSMDISDPEHPREASRVHVGDDERPHWIAIDGTGRRIVMNSGGAGKRLFLIDFDPATGQLALDRNFRDAGSDAPGISLTGANWPGFTGTVSPHGAVFSR